MNPPRARLSPSPSTPRGGGFLFAVALLLAGCGGGGASLDEPGGDAATPDATALEAEAWSAELEARSGGRQLLAPVGYGSLDQDDITVALRQGGLQIKVVPLAEWVIRLTAPDTYRRLNGYKVSRSEEILALAARAGERGWPTVVLVTFFSQSVEQSFEPNDLQIRNQGRTFRPFDIVAVTPSFGRDRIDQQETQVALYLFSVDIDLSLATSVSYGDATSDRWGSIRSTLDSERSRANSRAGAGQP